MSIRRWTASARAHMLEKHGVKWHEVEEVMSGRPRLFRGRTVRGQRRYQVVGRTAAARRLRVIVRLEGDTAWAITAYAES